MAKRTTIETTEYYELTTEDIENIIKEKYVKSNQSIFFHWYTTQSLSVEFSITTIENKGE